MPEGALLGPLADRLERGSGPATAASLCPIKGKRGGAARAAPRPVPTFVLLPHLLVGLHEVLLLGVGGQQAEVEGGHGAVRADWAGSGAAPAEGGEARRPGRPNPAAAFRRRSWPYPLKAPPPGSPPFPGPDLPSPPLLYAGRLEGGERSPCPTQPGRLQQVRLWLFWPHSRLCGAPPPPACPPASQRRSLPRRFPPAGHEERRSEMRGEIGADTKCRKPGCSFCYQSSLQESEGRPPGTPSLSPRQEEARRGPALDLRFPTCPEAHWQLPRICLLSQCLSLDSRREGGHGRDSFTCIPTALLRPGLSGLRP